MLYRHYPGVPLYKHAYELTYNMPRENQCRILFHFNAVCERRRYNAPDASIREIAVILQSDRDEVRDLQDIIIYRKHGNGLQCISDCYPFYPCLHYVLLFPTGQLGWHPAILYKQIEDQCYVLTLPLLFLTLPHPSTLLPTRLPIPGTALP